MGRLGARLAIPKQPPLTTRSTQLLRRVYLCTYVTDSPFSASGIKPLSCVLEAANPQRRQEKCLLGAHVV